MLRAAGKIAGRVWRSTLFRIYLVLLVCSHLVIAIWNPDFWMAYETPPETERIMVSIPAQTDEGPASGGRTAEIGVWRWSPDEENASKAPLILLHGSPSQGARDFRQFGPLLAREGREVLAIDRPGFGVSSKWLPSYSIRANARTVLAVMDALGIERAHVLGWSQGGGAALEMAEIAPERLASVVMLGSIGIQEGEGSGDYYFEHGKYRLGYLGLVLLPELIPHFNLMGDRPTRHSFIRDFMDSDQRPLRSIMESMHTPTLIVHGRRDPLVRSWVAEAHHEIIEPSRLVMLDASHFLPFGPPMNSERALELAAASIEAFCARHDVPGLAVRRGAANLAPLTESEEATIAGFKILNEMAWWKIVPVIVLGTLISEDLTVIAVGLLIAAGKIDAGVAILACFLGIIIGDYGLWMIGRFAGRRALRWPIIRRILPEASVQRWGRVLDRHIAKTVFISRCLPGTRMPMYLAAGILAKRSGAFLFWVTVAVFLWTPFLLVIAAILGPKLLGFFGGVLHGPWAILASFIVLAVLLRLAAYEATPLGRQRLKADLGRIVRSEFWPGWVFYLPLMAYLPWLGVRSRGLMVFTSANPGIANGGGVVGESKEAIGRGFAHTKSPFLHHALIEAGASAEERADRVAALVEREEAFNGWPVVLKPDQAQRGHGVKVVRTRAEAESYFSEMTRDVMVQRYHPGPKEAAIFWSRVLHSGLPVDECPGEIFSVTRKEFPVLVGNGEDTIESLIWHHPRYRLQAKIFMKRFADRLDLVLEHGQTLRLAEAGNHCQGTMFRDGADLITPELLQRVDAIAQGFRDPATGARIDFGRFDVRYTDDEALRRGEGFAIVEFNGTLSESTNMYDPERSLLWRYRVLFRQWSRLYALGAARRREGVRPLNLRDFRRIVREHFRGRPGSRVSD